MHFDNLYFTKKVVRLRSNFGLYVFFISGLHTLPFGLHILVELHA